MLHSDTFKAAMRLWASGVTVITWNSDKQYRPNGITVSAFSSLSLTPPLVLFCIDQNAFIYPQLCTQTVVTINILGAGQTDLAYQFAGGNRDGLENHLHFNNRHNLPMLKNAQANLIVKITNRIPQGDHDIFIAEIEEVELHPEIAPLLYHNSTLFTP